MSNALAAQNAAAIEITPLRLIQQASEQNVSTERMQQLFELQLRWEADQARKMFNQAMADFKKSPPIINKNKHVSFGEGTRKTEYYHASLDHVVDVITPVLSDLGIRHHWTMKQEGGMMTVTCFLTHVQGHSENTSMTAPYDQSGGKNAIQAIASSKTYLERHTLTGICGLAAKDVDDDANSAMPSEEAAPRLAESEFLERLESIRNAFTVEDLQAVYVPANKAAKAIDDEQSARAFADAKNKKYRELVAAAA